ncbi:hypothetical protein DSO57_1016578 [Entomophthora muscae]|uniref:Uncharacterized protein n=1 Tax=Entomophthora muscae TaxID=34485 RepID=A0ACC2TS65_9FUNG|nr:hypothetical protein DSO57_1016578 [Entomophthora muscae]
MHFFTLFLGFTSAIIIQPIKWGIFSDLFGDNIKFFDPSIANVVYHKLKNNTNFKKLLLEEKVVFDTIYMPKGELQAQLIKHRNQYIKLIRSRLMNPNKEKLFKFFMKIQNGTKAPKYNPKPIQDFANHINPTTLPRLRVFFATFDKILTDRHILKSIEAVAEKGFSFNNDVAWDLYNAIKEIQDKYCLLPGKLTQYVFDTFRDYYYVAPAE